jgi:hypothetical protein
MLLPAFIFIGMVGWFMCALDNKKPMQQRLTQNERRPQNDGVTFLPIVLEEPHETRVRNATSNR